MFGYWHDRITRAPEGAEGAGGGSGGSEGGGGNGGSGGNQNGGAGGGNQNGSSKPAWADEFGDQFDPERAWQTIANLRRETRKHQNDLKAATTKLTEYEGQNASELEKVSGKLTAAETELARYKAQEARAGLNRQIADVARNAGAIAPEDVLALLDADGIETDEAGKVKNGVALVNALKAAKPYLFQRGNINAGAGRQGRQGDSGEGSGNEFDRGVRAMFGVSR